MKKKEDVKMADVYATDDGYFYLAFTDEANNPENNAVLCKLVVMMGFVKNHPEIFEPPFEATKHKGKQ